MLTLEILMLKKLTHKKAPKFPLEALFFFIFLSLWLTQTATSKC